MPEIRLPTSKGSKREEELEEFAESLKGISGQIGFKVSSRGWCYVLEGAPYRLINKNQFDIVENLINDCRKNRYLPVDFTAEEESRKFSGVEKPNKNTPEQMQLDFLRQDLKVEEVYTPNWWEGEEYYIQMLVEKIDVKTLFEPVCREYKIPISTAKGWSSILQRAEYARRFKEAEDNGLKCVLLYLGDHDPDGLRISDFIQKNLEELAEIEWSDGEDGYDPANLIIERFGLNYDFIEENNLTWIDNLITGSGKNLASPTHKNFRMPYVQEYLRTIGERKCEANALLRIREQSGDLCREAIEKYLGNGSIRRFRAKRQEVRNRLQAFRRRTGLQEAIESAIRIIEEDAEDNETEEGDE
jgi:hypothetical protein